MTFRRKRSRSPEIQQQDSDLAISRLCSPQLRDPLTIALGFMNHPSLFRQCCKFTANLFDHAVYLEVFLPCAIVTPSTSGSCYETIPGFQCDQKELLNPRLGLEQAARLEIRSAGSLEVLATESLDLAKEVLATNLPRLTTIVDNNRWSVRRKRLLVEAPTLRNLPELTEIGDDSFILMPKLTSISLQGLPKLEVIGKLFRFMCYEVMQNEPEQVV